MRKLLAIVLCILCLSPVAEASEEKYVALTFDDGPSGRFTRRLLEGLEARDAKATFLLCGYRLEQYGGLAAEMASAGHELGVHGYSHRDWRTLSRRNLAEEIHLEEVAREAAMSSAYFSTLFKKLNGMTLWEYVQSRRIELAAEKLLNTDRNVGEIAMECGYNSISNFNRSFKTVTGQTPVAYRKANRE